MARISFWSGVSLGAMACLTASCGANRRAPAPAREPAAATPSDAAEIGPQGLRGDSDALSEPAPPRAPPAAAPPGSPTSKAPSAGAASDRPAPVEVGTSSAGQNVSSEFARRPPVGAQDPHGASGARVRLAEARRELEVATGERDCARACRALESMERAAAQVCELARSTDERRECASAGEQVDKARSKVQNACGACPQKPR